MKHVLSAAVALAFGLGVAVSAQAQNTNTNMAPAPTRAAPQAATQQPRMAAPAKMHQARVNYPKSHKAMVKEAQARLKQAGLYKGKIDGKWGHKSQQALAQFEQQHNLPATKKLNRSTFAALISTPAVGVGSTMPRQPAPAQANGMTHPTPAPTQAPGAGGPSGGGSNAGATNGANTGH